MSLLTDLTRRKDGFLVVVDRQFGLFPHHQDSGAPTKATLGISSTLAVLTLFSARRRFPDITFILVVVHLPIHLETHLEVFHLFLISIVIAHAGHFGPVNFAFFFVGAVFFVFVVLIRWSVASKEGSRR